jgi:4-hydroxy-tetrahydrodipicolinate reductase
MKIVLIGYGKMGKTIEKVALQRGHEIAGKIDLGDSGALPPADVAIEFTQPGSAVGNILRCVDAGIPVVCGTTGWLDRQAEVAAYVHEKKGSLFYASNFSLGVNIFFHLNQYLAQLMERHHAYVPVIDETHHTEKRDAPSGTAITLAEGILKNNTTKKEWSLSADATDEKLIIHSYRKDPAPGTHVVRYHSPIDDIEITHTAHSREGFATGAVQVAEWLPGKKGVFGMNDFLKF